MSRPVRIGLVVPSSNTTMETEIPALLHRHAELGGSEFTFHSSRSRLRTVDPESLHAMVADGARCVGELADAAVDVIAYACLVAVMAEGSRAHERIESELAAVPTTPIPVVSSAGALVDTLGELGITRPAVIAPYMPPLTSMVLSYLSEYGITPVDSVSLCVPDNLAVGRLDPAGLLTHAGRLDLGAADGIVVSACVQMPSLAAVADVEQTFGLPTVSAATSTARQVLQRLGMAPTIPGAGAALGDVAPARAGG